MHISAKVGTTTLLIAMTTGTVYMIKEHDPSRGGIGAYRGNVPSAPNVEKTVANPTARVFGHAMIPGGVHDLETLRRFLSEYPPINLDALVFTTLPNAEFAFVSYRLDGKTLWTKAKRLIPQGEPIFTDGNIIGLQHCGNMIRFDTPKADEISLNEPLDLYPPQVGPIAPTINDTASEFWMPPTKSVAKPNEAPWQQGITVYGVLINMTRLSG